MRREEMPNKIKSLEDLPSIDGLPVFEASLRLGGRGCCDKYVAEFDCPACGGSHAHGWPAASDSEKPQRRGSNCASPTLHEGYYLILDLAGRQLINSL
jgi:hypothetical protein